MKKNKHTTFSKKILSNKYVVNILMMIAIAAVIIWGILFYLDIYTRHNESVTVPALKGLSLNDAQALLESSDLRYEVVDSVYQEFGTPGTVIDQIPKENSQVKEDRNIYLTIQARNEPLIKVPELEYASLRQAEALLMALGFRKPQIKYEASQFQDLVLGVMLDGQSVDAGEKIAKSSELTILVGDGYGGRENGEENDSIPDSNPVTDDISF